MAFYLFALEKLTLEIHEILKVFLFFHWKLALSYKYDT